MGKIGEYINDMKFLPGNEMPRVGDKIKILSVDEGDRPDPYASVMVGKIFVVKGFDSRNIWLEGCGLSLLPDADRYEIVERVDVN